MFKSDFVAMRLVKHASLEVSTAPRSFPAALQSARRQELSDAPCTRRQGIKENYEWYRRHLRERLRMGEDAGQGSAAGGKAQAFGHFGQAQPGNGARPAAVTALLLALLGAALLAVLIACYLVRPLPDLATTSCHAWRALPSLLCSRSSAHGLLAVAAQPRPAVCGVHQSSGTAGILGFLAAFSPSQALRLLRGCMCCAACRRGWITWRAGRWRSGCSAGGSSRRLRWPLAWPPRAPRLHTSRRAPPSLPSCPGVGSLAQLPCVPCLGSNGRAPHNASQQTEVDARRRPLLHSPSQQARECRFSPECQRKV